VLTERDRVPENLCLEKENTKRSKISEITAMFIMYQYLDFAQRGNRDSSVGIVIKQGAGKPRDRNWILHRSNRFICPSRASSRAHPDHYSVGTRGHFPGLKRRRGEAKHTHPATAEVTDEWRHTTFMACTGTNLLFKILS
jgi:hypothetical protein